MCSCGEGHANWGQCIRAKNIRVGSVEAPRYRAGDKELEDYRAARRDGIQPEGTRRHHIDAAVRASDHLGEPFRA